MLTKRHVGSENESEPEVKVHPDFCVNLRSVLLDFQSFTEKVVFECAFAHPRMLFLSYLVKNSMDHARLAMKWYLMPICSS